ncbi:flagellar filament capping protein FliD [Lysinibacillus sphaericus]|uniref:Flagellar hook-associated protein 2 n=3 Tax=Lysinibacillus TaxID=400634 RepID=B1HN63_LYSSC|nr:MULTISPECIES: flagellar filament capping protein FliD [Lysinibacillus]MBE5084780.1 flagellar filament capping protein FliD [Bacillus thuringiensis]ACA38780.1 Flagellar hook-associated protein 2 (HAP2) (Filament cap protein) (Flagellar cap protein) [Lysinibacillus sphaericus C3-41]AMO34963.1 flagellar hook protein [Lysinibacillus sphaericus]AMR89922.1 flagellar hook protein [Lysinibacillus sphaericus]ANA47992.1 flagellar hook protein [Lysinibacillus sphaericus]
MVNRIGGLASGMDIDALVKKLMNAEKAPLNKLYQKKQTYEWQRDAYRSVNTKLKTFDTYIADNLVLKSFLSKTAASSNSNLVTATATGSAAGTLSIEGVSQLATAARKVGDQVNAVGTTKISDFASTGTIEFKAIQTNGKLASEATKIEITSDMTVDQFISKVNSSNAGISAVFENGRFSFTAKNTGDVKGDDEIKVVGGLDIFNKLGFADPNKVQNTEGKNAIFTVNGIATERTTNTFTISGYNVTLKDTFNGLQTIADKYKAAVEELKNATTNLANKQANLITKQNAYGASDINSYTANHETAYKNAFGNTLSLSQQVQYNKLGNDAWRNLSTDEIDFIKNQTSVQGIKDNIDGSTLSDESKAKLKGLSNSALDVLFTNKDQLTDFKAQAEYEKYGVKLKDFDQNAIDALKRFSYNSSDSIEKIHKDIDDNPEFTKEVKDALKSLSKDDLTNLIATDSATLKTYQEKAQADDFKQKYSQLGDALIKELQEGTKKVEDLTEKQKEIWNSLSPEKKGQFYDLADQNIKRSEYLTAVAEEKAAQTRLTEATNTEKAATADATAAGILKDDGSGGKVVDEDKVNAAPQAQAVTMTSTTDVDDIMAKIKEFVTTYNGFIKDLNDQTKETKYRDYTPLTSEQREEMSESEIKLWEEKAKSGLLRGDTLIREGLAGMRSLVYQSNPGIDSKYNSLFSIGITTSKNYNDGGTLEIDEAKLRKVLEEDPDAVEKLFKNSEGKKDDVVDGKTVDTRGYLDKLRGSMKTFEITIEKKAGRSTMTDAQYAIGKNLVDTESRISTWKRKLEDIEARYWKQFTAMEQAINKANQQSSMFMQG